MEIANIISEKSEELKQQLIDWRRDFHRHPELGFAEKRTAGIVAGNLEEWGLEVTGMAGTGVVGLLEGGREGKTIAIRADMDALPLEELNDVDYKSVNEGKMHACGHDGHTAIALGAARILSTVREELPGQVKFIFQPAEEGPGGARPMIEEGVLKNPRVDAIIGLHIFTDIPSGKIGIKEGPIMAAPDHFKVIIKGQGAHGAHPEEGVDPVVVGSQVVLALQQLVSRETDPLEPVVLTCGTFKSGSNFNIIPEKAEITGTVRTFSPELRKQMKKRVEEVVAGVTSSLRADSEVEYNFRYPPTVNNREVTGLLSEVIKEIAGEEGIFRIEKPSMGGEDFAYYLQQVPGAFVFLGTGNPEKGITHSIHNPRFDLDEDILPLGVEFFCRSVIKYLNS